MPANRIDESDDNLAVLVSRGHRSPAFGQWWQDCARTRRAYLAVRLDGDRSSIEVDLLPAGQVLSAIGQAEVATAMEAAGARSWSFGFGDTIRTARASDLAEQADEVLMQRLLQIVGRHAVDQ